MKTKEKILIAAAAVMITLIGFSLIASPAFDLMSIGSKKDTAITVTWQIDAEKTAAHWDPISQFSPFPKAHQTDYSIGI